MSAIFAKIFFQILLFIKVFCFKERMYKVQTTDKIKMKLCNIVQICVARKKRRILAQ